MTSTPGVETDMVVATTDTDAVAVATAVMGGAVPMGCAVVVTLSLLVLSAVTGAVAEALVAAVVLIPVDDGVGVAVFGIDVGDTVADVIVAVLVAVGEDVGVELAVLDGVTVVDGVTVEESVSDGVPVEVADSVCVVTIAAGVTIQGIHRSGRGRAMGNDGQLRGSQGFSHANPGSNGDSSTHVVPFTITSSPPAVVVDCGHPTEPHVKLAWHKRDAEFAAGCIVRQEPPVTFASKTSNDVLVVVGEAATVDSNVLHAPGGPVWLMSLRHTTACKDVFPACVHDSSAL